MRTIAAITGPVAKPPANTMCAARCWKRASPRRRSASYRRNWACPTGTSRRRPACPSRIPYGTTITLETLSQVERAEALLHGLGLRQLRVRHHGAVARIEAEPDDFARLLEHREEIVTTLKAHWLYLCSARPGRFPQRQYECRPERERSEYPRTGRPVMDAEKLRQLLEAIQQGQTSVEEALERLRQLPYEDLGYARLDLHRALRNGMPEVVFCEGKTIPQATDILKHLWQHHDRVMGTRVAPEMAEAILKAIPEAHYDPTSRLVTSGPRRKSAAPGRCALCPDRHRRDRRYAGGRGSRPDARVPGVAACNAPTMWGWPASTACSTSWTC